MPQIDPHQLFSQLFSHMHISQGTHFVQIPQNTVMRSTSTRIENGKKIVTITEKINGQTRVQTITSDINSPDLLNIMQNININ